MAKPATSLNLTLQEEQIIRELIQEAEQQQLKAERARVVLLAAQGWTTQQIAQKLGMRPARVSKWRTRFARYGLSGLENAARPGRPPSYDPTIDARILSLTRQAPPEPQLAWTGTLLAQLVGNVSEDHVWKVLRKHGISLRHADPREYEIDQTPFLKMAGIIGLYITHETCAFLIGVGDPTALGAGMHLRGLIRAPTAELADALKSLSSARPTFLEALQWATSLLEVGRYRSHETRTLRDFLSDARRHSPTSDIHAFVVSPQVPVIPGVCYHPLPAFGAWRDQLESWFAVFLPPARPNDSSPISQLLDAIERVFLVHSRTPVAAAFEWRARPVASRQADD